MITETDDYKAFLNGYIACAMWSSHEENDTQRQFDGLTADNLSDDGLAVLSAHALSYYAQVWPYVTEDENATPHIESGSYTHCAFSQLGHDFWLDQNGHGAGAQDGHWPKYGDMFARVAVMYPIVDLSLDENGLVTI